MDCKSSSLILLNSNLSSSQGRMQRSCWFITEGQCPETWGISEGGQTSSTPSLWSLSLPTPSWSLSPVTSYLAWSETRIWLWMLIITLKCSKKSHRSHNKWSKNSLRMQNDSYYILGLCARLQPWWNSGRLCWILPVHIQDLRPWQQDDGDVDQEWDFLQPLSLHRPLQPTRRRGRLRVQPRLLAHQLLQEKIFYHYWQTWVPSPKS